MQTTPPADTSSNTATRKVQRKAKIAANPKTSDRVTAWAQNVVAGKIVAGPYIRAAAARHLNDIVDGPSRGLSWNAQAAGWAIGYFEEVLHLNGGEYEGKPFNLLGWEAFVIGSLYGWLRANDDSRRFRVAYVETGKGSGKSPLAAGIGMHGLTADGESRAEIYAAATKRDQAMVLFRDAVAMFEWSPELSQRLTSSGVGEKTWNLSYPATGSFFRPISADQGQSGPRPHIGLIDEFHEHPTNHVVEMMRAGFKNRRQPLLFIITNSGHDRTSPCGQYHDYAANIAQGTAKDDAFFGFVCSLDKGDDPFLDEACWPKVNPSLVEANLPGLDYLRQQVLEARGLPSKLAIVRRLNFCEWTQAHNPWLSPQIWTPAARDYSADELHGRRAYGGLDLASTTDLASLTLAVEPVDENEPWKLLSWSWTPEDGLAAKEDQDKVPYSQWLRDGWLHTTPGRAISKLAILKFLHQVAQDFDLVSVAFDRWRVQDLVAMAADAEIELPIMVEYGQGFKDMSPAVEQFETQILSGQLVHNNNPLLTWAAANAVIVDDDAANRKLSKAKATGRIDPMIAAVMAVGSASRHDKTNPLSGYMAYISQTSEAARADAMHNGSTPADAIYISQTSAAARANFGSEMDEE